ncbi:MAG: winged helix-turn-helix domain-containing protein [Candidatus Bathyarchaeia archaeon]
MNLEEYAKEKLWPILVETVHAMVMYAHHKAYTREVILQEKPDINPQELAVRLNIPLGEALVILKELADEEEEKLKS